MKRRLQQAAAALGLLACVCTGFALTGHAAGGWPGGSDGYAPSGSIYDGGHYYMPDSWQKVSDANCVSAEKWVRYCVWTYWNGKQCGYEDTKYIGKKDPSNHVNTEIRNAKAATCEEDGYTGDVYCKDCKKIVKKGEKIDKLDHDYKEAERVEPTCTKDGYIKYVCSRDSSHTYTETLKATGHLHTETRNAKAATCEKDGYTGDLYCKDCDTLLKKGEKINKLGHDYKETDRVEPTCTADGYIEYVCSRDSSHTYKETLKATGHTYKKTIFPPTCTEKGRTYYICIYDGDVYVDDWTDPLGHDYQLKGHKDATCTEDGYDYYECSRDATHNYTKTIKATGHDYTEKVVPPTCTEEGYTIYTCNNCGDVYTGNKTAALGHDYQLKGHKDATCTEDGYDYYECSRDAIHNYTVKIAATGHMYGKTVVEPTCTEGGYTEYTCAYCGDSYRIEPTDPLGHDWDEGVVTAGPTCTEAGEKVYTCRRCQTTRTEALDALGHNWTSASTALPPCQNTTFRHEGENITLCPICGLQDGVARLFKLDASTLPAGGVVLKGTLANGMEAMTVAFYDMDTSTATTCTRCGASGAQTFSRGGLIRREDSVQVTVDASQLAGYTLMLVHEDGSENALEITVSGGKASFVVPFEGREACLFHLVPVTAE